MKMKPLKSDLALSNVVRQARKDKDYTYILFTSPWDTRSDYVREWILANDFTNLYEVSYFDAPQSWMQFKVEPGTLVKMNAKKVVVYPGLNAVKNAI
jgi:hypothetical protein